MNINTAEFVKGIRGTDSILSDPYPQIAFIGRSNVGKSSVINSLTGRNSLVKSSSVPGKTREINYFLINKSYYFVDLPGYGFARIAPKQREKLQKLIWWYLTSEETHPYMVVLIVDARHGPTELDVEMFETLIEYNHPILILANKADKISKNERFAQQKKIEDVFPGTPIMWYSAKTHEGREEVRSYIMGEPNTGVQE